MKKLLFVVMTFLLFSCCAEVNSDISGFYKEPIKWEEIGYIGSSEIYRTPVPNGWLVYARAGSWQGGTSLIFIADSLHIWNSETIKYEEFTKE